MKSFPTSLDTTSKNFLRGKFKEKGPVQLTVKKERLQNEGIYSMYITPSEDEGGSEYSSLTSTSKP